MKKLASVLAMSGLGLVVSGCAMLGLGGGGGGGVDFAKSMAGSPAQYMIQLHADAEVGQYTVTESSGAKMWWGVTDTKGDYKVVENRMKMGEAWVTSVFVVDAEGMVQEAYVANYDPEAEELQEAYSREVGKKPDPVDAPAGDEPETGEETINVAGQDWACKWSKTGDAKVWMCDTAWFGKMIQMEYQGKMMSTLVEVGTDATIGFKYPEEGGE